MKRKSIQVTVFVFLSVLAALPLAVQDKYTVKVPNGLSFSEFSRSLDSASVLRNVFLQCVRSDAFRCPGFLKSERKRVELFGFLFLRYLVFILDAVNFSDCLNCATGKDLTLGAFFHRQHGMAQGDSACHDG